MASRKDNLMHRYGLTEDTWDKMYYQQAGRCDICLAPKDPSEMHTDHCHYGKQVRSLLCRPCNLLLGHAVDNPEVLRRAAEYLKRNTE